MQRISIFTLLSILILTANSLFSVDKNSEDVTFEVPEGKISLDREPGDFVIYHNKFGGNNRIVIMIYLEEDHYYLKSIGLDYEEVNTFHINITPDTEEVTDMGIIEGDIANQDLKNTQIDLMNFMMKRFEEKDNPFFPNLLVEDPWPGFGYTLIYDFRFWIPILNIYERYEEENRESTFKVIRFGNLDHYEQDYILNYDQREPDILTGPLYKFPQAEPNDVVFDGLMLKLDQNWEVLPDQNIALLSVNDERYSYFNINTLAKEQVGLSAYQIFSWELKNSKGYIRPESIEIFQFQGIPTLEYTIIDETTKLETKSIMLIFDRGEHISIVSFGAYLSVYEENKEYFDLIIY